MSCHWLSAWRLSASRSQQDCLSQYFLTWLFLMSELWFLKLPYRLLTGDFFIASCGHSWWCFCCQGVLLVLLSHCWSRWLLINKVCSPSVFFHSISSDLAQGSRLSSGENWIRIDWPVPSMRRPGQVTLTRGKHNQGDCTPNYLQLFLSREKVFLELPCRLQHIWRMPYSNCWS